MEMVYHDGGRGKYFKAENVGDCAVRAIAIATGKDYKEVYNDLKKLNHGKSCRNGTPKNVDKKYLTQLGWVWHPTMQVGSGCKVHLNADELPKGTLIVAVSKHLTCVKDGVLYDTYDCSRDGTRCVYGYWTKPKEKAYSRNTIDLDIEAFMANLAYGTSVELVDSETAEIVYESDSFKCPWGTRKEYIGALIECIEVRDNTLIVWIKKKNYHL